MIPQLVTVHHRRRDGRWSRWYVPVVPVLLLLSPLLALVVAAAVIACVVVRVSPTGALRGVARVLLALPGARFEIDDGSVAVRVAIR